jgi:hypothetical protein
MLASGNIHVSSSASEPTIEGSVVACLARSVEEVYKEVKEVQNVSQSPTILDPIAIAVTPLSKYERKQNVEYSKTDIVNHRERDGILRHSIFGPAKQF